MLTVAVCVGSSCHLKGSYEVISKFQALIRKWELQELVELKGVFCMNHCTGAVSVRIDDGPPIAVFCRWCRGGLPAGDLAEVGGELVGVLTTVETECKDCYKCVRACPVKAIKVNTGHAQIWEEQCILDGHCISVCPRQAKRVRDDLPTVQALLAKGETVAVSLAPSYVCAFDLPEPGMSGYRSPQAGVHIRFRNCRRGRLCGCSPHCLLAEDHESKKEPRITSSCPTISKPH